MCIAVLLIISLLSKDRNDHTDKIVNMQHHLKDLQAQVHFYVIVVHSGDIGALMVGTLVIIIHFIFVTFFFEN